MRPKSTVLLMLLTLLGACKSTSHDYSPAERHKNAQTELTQAKSELDRFYALGEAAKTSLDVGDYATAEVQASELLSLAPKYPADWNYGNAIHEANIVLGRIELSRGNRETAIIRLLAAGDTPGSPQLDSFGPNMTLARDLLEKKETKAVLEYFDKCRVFWKMDNGQLDAWANDVKEGRMPSFGANLLY